MVCRPILSLKLDNNPMLQITARLQISAMLQSWKYSTYLEFIYVMILDRSLAIPIALQSKCLRKNGKCSQNYKVQLFQHTHRQQNDNNKQFQEIPNHHDIECSTVHQDHFIVERPAIGLKMLFIKDHDLLAIGDHNPRHSRQNRVHDPQLQWSRTIVWPTPSRFVTQNDKE